jgi:hypothetical protein
LANLCEVLSVQTNAAASGRTDISNSVALASLALGLTHSITVGVDWAWLALIELTITSLVTVGTHGARNLSKSTLETVESSIADLTVLSLTVWS